MVELAPEVVSFFNKQNVVIVSTLDARGHIHCAAKGLVGIKKEGKVCIIDLYQLNTFDNLKRSAAITITAVDEPDFIGYSLKGRGKIVERQEIKEHVIAEWDERVVQRISQRVIANIRKSSQDSFHPEAQLPLPQYLITVEVEEVVDLTPAHIKEESKKPGQNK